MNNNIKKPIICCSYPKSGRSWFRFILANYINEVYRLNLTINFNNLFSILPNNGPDPKRGINAYKFKKNPDIPFILFDHSLHSPQYANIPIIFILRNIYDTLVSNYFQDKYRIECFNGNIQQYIRSENGISRLAIYINSWSKELLEKKHTIISYEMMHHNIYECMASIIEKALKADVDKNFLQHAIDLSSFENMKKIEITSGFPNQKIKINASDSKTLRAREGKVRNYDKHLDDNDINYINSKSRHLMSDASLQLLSKYCQ